MMNYHRVFNDEEPNGLDNDHFFDAISENYSPLPAFGIDYMGKRVLTSDAEDLFLIRYKGRNTKISAQSKYGEHTENDRLLRIHDILFYNFKWLSKNNDLTIFKFLENNLDPTNTQTQFEMELIDSLILVNPETQARVNSLEMTYQIILNK
jgi:hypothetical protein